MTNLQRACLLATFLAVTAMSYGQQRRSAALKPLAFLTGRWVSEKGSEVQEESWLPVSGDSMTGTFRVVQGDKPVFYEFWALEVDDNRPVLKLKHFNAGLVGWEDKNSSTKMPLVSNAEDDAVFAEGDGSVSLHYHRTGAILTCVVHHVQNGKSSDETFTLTKTPAS